MSAKHQSRTVDLTEGKIVPVLLKFTVPFILTGILQQLYAFCDSMIVGNLVGADALAAVNSSVVILNLFLCLVNGLVTGASIMVSHGYKKRNVELKAFCSRSAALVLAFSLPVMLVCLFGAEAILRLIRTPGDILPRSLEYFNVISFQIPLMTLYSMAGAFVRGMGDSRRPFLILLASNVLNIAMDLLFIRGFGMGIAGAALATVLAQGAALVMIVPVVMRQLASVPAPEEESSSGGALREWLRISVPCMLSNCVMTMGALAVAHVRNSFGEVVVRGISGAYNIDCFLLLPFICAGNSFSIFTSMNAAAGKGDRIRAGVRLVNLCLFLYAVPMLAALVAFAPVLLGLFGLAQDSVAVGFRFLCTTAVFYPMFGVVQVLTGYLQGVKRTKETSALNVAGLGLRIALSYLLMGVIGADVIAWAEIGSWVFMLAVVLLLYKRPPRTAP